MPLIIGAKSASASTGVANSCRFNLGDDPVMEKSLGTPTSTKIFTVSAWVKAMSDASTDTCVAGGYVSSSDVWNLQFGSSKIQLTGTGNLDLATTQLFRDPSAWWHICMAVDTSQATDTNRVKLYVNGTQITSFSTTTYPTQDDVPAWCSSSGTLYVGNGRTSGALSKPFDGYIAEFCFVDGQQLAPTSFGEFDSDSPTIWKPIDVSGLTFGNNGCYLDFEDSSNLGNDANGGTDLTESNLDATDQATDSPTNNFATFNPLNHPNPSEVPTMSQGNCQGQSTDSGHEAGFATIGVSAGKWYAEFKLSASTSTANALVGVIKDPISSLGTDDLDGSSLFYAVQGNGSKIIAGSTTTGWADTFTTGDIIGVALDVDNSKIYFSKAGQWTDGDGNYDEAAPNAYIDLSAGDTWFFCPAEAANLYSSTWQADFGGCSAFTVSSANQDANGYGNFEYAPPSGYLALCTKNLGSDGG